MPDNFITVTNTSIELTTTGSTGTINIQAGDAVYIPGVGSGVGDKLYLWANYR